MSNIPSLEPSEFRLSSQRGNNAHILLHCCCCLEINDLANLCHETTELGSLFESNGEEDWHRPLKGSTKTKRGQEHRGGRMESW